MNAPFSAIAAGRRRAAWIALLVAASVVISLGFACATPFAAIAAVAVLTLTRRDALLLVGLVWLANQVVGFGVLNYPWMADCLAWGAGLGVIALLSALAAEFGAERLLGRNRVLASIMAFLSAFAVYEGLLFVASSIIQGGVDNFAPTLVGRIFAINAVAFVGLFAAAGLGASGFGGKRDHERRIRGVSKPAAARN